MPIDCGPHPETIRVGVIGESLSDPYREECSHLNYSPVYNGVGELVFYNCNDCDAVVIQKDPPILTRWQRFKSWLRQF
jgi:hypothetical protein